MAKDVFKKLLDERPDDHETRGALGKIYVNLEDYDDALPLLEDTSIKRPGDSDVLYDLGLCYFKTKQYKKSLDIFENMRLAYGAEKGVRAWLGRCHEMLGDDKQALFYYREELELFPWSPEGAEFLYFYYKEKNSTAAAFEVLEQAKAAVKKKPAEAMSMGVMLTRCHLFERGLELSGLPKVRARSAATALRFYTAIWALLIRGCATLKKQKSATINRLKFTAAATTPCTTRGFPRISPEGTKRQLNI